MPIKIWSVMEERIIFAKYLTITLFFISCSVLLAACGGGTSGTGGTGSTQFAGRVLSDGLPVEDALVTVLESGDTGLTDSQGDFEVSTLLQSDSATLLVESGQVQAQTTIPDIASDVARVELTLSLDKEQQSVNVDSRTDIKATPTPKPKRPRPTPTSQPELQLTPAPTPAPTPEPTLQVTPSPNWYHYYSGRIIADERLLKDMTISINGIESASVTKGLFRITLRNSSGPAVLTVSTSGLSDSITFRELPTENYRLSMKLYVSIKGDTLKIAAGSIIITPL